MLAFIGGAPFVHSMGTIPRPRRRSMTNMPAALARGLRDNDTDNPSSVVDTFNDIISAVDINARLQRKSARLQRKSG